MADLTATDDAALGISLTDDTVLWVEPGLSVTIPDAQVVEVGVDFVPGDSSEEEAVVADPDLEAPTDPALEGA